MGRKLRQLYSRLKPLMTVENRENRAGNKISSGKNKYKGC